MFLRVCTIYENELETNYDYYPKCEAYYIPDTRNLLYKLDSM